MSRNRLKIATALAMSVVAGLAAVLAAGGAAPATRVNAECSVYDPLFDEDEWFPEGMTLEADVGNITCHNGHWDGPNVDSPLPGGGGDIAT